MQPGKPNTGLKLPAEEVAREIVKRETDPTTGKREQVAFGVLDPAAFAVISGPSIAETLHAQRRRFPPGRQQPRLDPEEDGRVVGTAQRLKGDEDGNPMLFVFSTCRELIRTMPDAASTIRRILRISIRRCEDHLADTLRYMVLSRPYRSRRMARSIDPSIAKSPFLVSNAFRFSELRD